MYQKRPMNSAENERGIYIPLGTTLEAMQETFIRATLARLDGSRRKASEMLGISIRTLQRKLRKHRAYDQSEENRTEK